jgi:hypothetical protein
MGPFTTLLRGDTPPVAARPRLDPSVCPARDLSCQCEYILFAAALFVGCTMFEGTLGAAGAEQPMAAPVPANSAAAAAPAALPAVSGSDERAFAEAVLLYRAGRWSAAYGRFMALADRGHVRSARIALAMQRDGAYATPWNATAQQLLEWEHTAGQDIAPQVALGQ